MRRTPDGVNIPGFNDINALPPHGTEDRYLMLRWEADRWGDFAETFAKSLDDRTDQLATIGMVTKGCVKAFYDYCDGEWVRAGGTPSSKRDYFLHLETSSKRLLEALLGQPVDSPANVIDALAVIPQHARVNLLAMHIIDELQGIELPPGGRERAAKRLAVAEEAESLILRNQGGVPGEYYSQIQTTVQAVANLWRWSSRIANGVGQSVTNDSVRNRRQLSPIVRFRIGMIHTFLASRDAIAGGKGMAGELSDMVGGPLDTFLQSAERFLSETFDEPLPERSATSTKHAYQAYRRALSNQP